MQLYHFSRKEQQINQECDELSAFITDLDPLLSSRTHWRESKKKGRIGGLGEGDTSLNKFQKMTVLCFCRKLHCVIETLNNSSCCEVGGEVFLVTLLSLVGGADEHRCCLLMLLVILVLLFIIIVL